MQPNLLIDDPRRVILLGRMKNRLAERLRAIVLKNDAQGVNQAELARKCGLTPARFNNYVTDTRKPDLDTLMRMAKALETTPDYLLGFSESASHDVANVLIPLLELAGMESTRAEAVAETAQEALRALAASQDDGDAAARSRMAAQLAWQLRGGPKPLQ